MGKNITTVGSQKWAENDETWSGNTQPKTKIMLNGLVERYMNKTNSNDLEIKVMEDWMRK